MRARIFFAFIVVVWLILRLCSWVCILIMFEFRDVWEKDGCVCSCCVCSRKRREKGRKEKKSFLNSTDIILRGNIICISYSSSPRLESYCSKSKKKIRDGEVVGGVFFLGVNSDFFGEKIEITWLMEMF